MEKITINTLNHRSEILIGEDWTSFLKYADGRKPVIITDDNVNNIYGKHFSSCDVISIIPGEKSKRLEVINELAVKLLNLGVDRGGYIVGIGGGVVCDIAGFLASVYMRGISFGFVSTSLLSQVDASVGGKNGVNVGHVKNILGNFNQPDFVICDPTMLITLPDEEYLSGLAELVKTGIIYDEKLISEFEKNIVSIRNRDLALLTRLITRAVEIKAQIVSEDEKESGIRMILNFGHTFGHAIEALTSMKHGFAVAAGMVIAADISVESNLLSPDERNRIYKLLESLQLLKSYDLTAEQIMEYLSQDKKKTGDNVNFVFIQKTGLAKVEKISMIKLVDYYTSCKSSK